MLGKWISDGSGKPFYARRVINIDEHPVSAKVKVCGLGQFVLHINGNKVGDHELDPGWTNYNKRIQFVKFDITDCLRQGENVIGAEVGNGWFIMGNEHYTFKFPSFMPPNPNPYQPFGDRLVLNIKLELEYSDGRKEIICTDEYFKVRKHEILMSNVYGSETADGADYPKGWDDCGYDDSNWKTAEIVSDDKAPRGELEEQCQPPIKVIRRYEAKYLHTVATRVSEQSNELLMKDSFLMRKIYDLGQNISGILNFEVKGKKGKKLCFYPAEKLSDDGDADQMAKNWMPIDSCITYTIGKDDEWEKFRMKFTYFAGRYFAVEGLTEGEVELRNFYGDAISSAWETDGYFHCDDERYNSIYNLVEKAVEANMLSVHTDCPTIERFAWQEPNHLMAPSIMFMKRSDTLWDKFLKDMRTDQHKASDSFSDGKGGKFYPGDGLMPSQCPCYIPNVLPVPGMGSFYDIIPWGSTCILGTYWHYMFYGNNKIIEDNYDAGKRYLVHELSMRNAEGFINHGLGDWGHPENIFARENIETSFLYADLVVMSKFAKILGLTDDEENYNNLAKEVKENYNEKLLVTHPQKGYKCYKVWDKKEELIMTQAIEALPLYLGMVPIEYENDVLRAFRDTLLAKNALISGEVGLPYIIRTACRYGMNNLISEFITKETHPSYYAFVLDGETTLGEYWEKNPRSHCHDMMGHIIEWFYTGIAGIKLLEPGFKKVEISPYLPLGMNEFTCTYNSVNGVIKVKVLRTGEKIKVTVKADEGIKWSLCTTL